VWCRTVDRTEARIHPTKVGSSRAFPRSARTARSTLHRSYATGCVVQDARALPSVTYDQPGIAATSVADRFDVHLRGCRQAP
jgi:hypothetical protein